MRLRLATLLLLCAGPAFASGFADSGGNTCTRGYLVPNVAQYVSTTGTLTASTTNGLVQCAEFTPSCNLLANTLGFEVETGGGAGATCQVAIMSTTSGDAPLLASEIEDCSAAGIQSTTGLTPVALSAGTQYVLCWSSSTSGTLKWRTGVANLTMSAATGALSDSPNLAQFNANCVSNELNADCIGAGNPYVCCSGAATGTCLGPTPYACCTGSGTGTCTGIQSLGAVTSNTATTAPLVLVTYN